MHSTRATFPEEELVPDTLVLRTFDRSELQDTNSNTAEHLPMFYTHENTHVLSLRVDATELPAPSAVAPSPFTHLTVIETTPETAVHPTDVLRLLTGFPALVAFDWTSNGESAAATTTVRQLPEIVDLPQLTDLIVRSTPAIRPFLTRIDAPALRTILLDNINVADSIAELCPPDLSVTQTDAEDDRDEDGQIDFSQSPHSDRATGMGLRHLLRHPNPPLERLDMDYADMRSKDFRWCFNNLNKLTALRLVGSDIPDKAFELLRPYTPEGETSERLRLPKLEELEIQACGRLTGDVIVSVLRARDTLGKKVPAITRLKTVKVIGCSEFTADHEYELKRSFGDRLSFV
jgi:hypothetical protein